MTSKPLWHGIMLVAGGAVGAGMFALPMASAGPWMLWASLGFLFVWLMTYTAASLLAKVNLALVDQAKSDISLNSSFDALVTRCLGHRWAQINNLCILFIMMILMYAYTTAGGTIISFTLETIGVAHGQDWRPWFSLAFATIIALIVGLGTSMVSRVSLFLMVAMAIMFWVATLGIMPTVNTEQLLQPIDTAPFLFAALPVYITAFACAGLIPTLVRHYPERKSHVFKSVLWGTLIALLVYLFWLYVTLGSVGREGLQSVMQQGGNIDDLVAALVERGADTSIQSKLTLFSHCAIMTSFLSIGLGLFHFMQDKLSLTNSPKHKLTAVVCCFAPPALASFAFPYGFVYAISFAGLFVSFSFFILPGMMARALRKEGILYGVNLLIVVSIAFGVGVLLLKVGVLMNGLPVLG